MTAHVDVFEKNKKDKALYIPANAVFSDASRNSFVWLIRDENKVTKQKVEVGKLVKDSIEIKKGLTQTSKIVTSAVRFLNENDEVKAYKKIGN